MLYTTIMDEKYTGVDYSIIIPAYNEEDELPLTLEKVQAAMSMLPLSGEVIVTDNNSTDATAQVARHWGATVVFEGHNQIARARNAGARVARGRYFVFVDADTRISPELLQAALAALASGKVAGGGARVGFDREVSGLSKAILGVWNWVSRSFGVAAGSFVYCLREGFEGMGGFNESVYAGEEVWFSRALKRWARPRKLAFVVQPIAVETSGRKLDWHPPWRIAQTLLWHTLWPWSVKKREHCSFWYKRPEKKESPQ